jgi:hypothetical protein
MIGNNVMRVEAEGTQERVVAAVATAQAGYTTATEDGARNGESLKSQHPLVTDYSRNWTIGFGSFSVVPLRLPGTGVNLTARLQKLAADVSGAYRLFRM